MMSLEHSILYTNTSHCTRARLDLESSIANTVTSRTSPSRLGRERYQPIFELKRRYFENIGLPLWSSLAQAHPALALRLYVPATHYFGSTSLITFISMK
eukprot:1395559-Amorphochlora_amoeboformis.AAC.2